MGGDIHYHYIFNWLLMVVQISKNVAWIGGFFGGCEIHFSPDIQEEAPLGTEGDAGILWVAGHYDDFPLHGILDH